MPPQEITVPASTAVSPLSVTPVALKPGAPPAGSDPAVATAPGVFSQQFGSPEQSSRGFATALGNHWRVRRSVELFPETEPRGLLASRDRIVVLGRIWQLYDREGRQLVRALSGPGAVALSEQGEAVLAIDATGALRRYSSATGELEFRIGAGRGSNVHYSLVTSRGPDHLLAGAARALDPHGLHPPRFSYLQAFNVAAPFSVDDAHLLQSTASEQEWELPGAVLVGAASGDTGVFARRDLVFTTDRSLSALRAISGRFLPRALSVSAGGVVHLIVDAERGSRYWRILPDGTLVLDFPLSPGQRTTSTPPILGADGRVLVHRRGTRRHFRGAPACH